MPKCGCRYSRAVACAVAAATPWVAAHRATCSVVAFTPLGTLPGTSLFMLPNDVSANGQVVVGAGLGSAGASEGAFWTAAGVQRMGDINAALPFRSYSLSVSGDGQTIVGYGKSQPSLTAEAMRATIGQPMQTLYGPPSSGQQSKAMAASADGSVIVGWEGTSSGSIAFRWTAATGRQFLGSAVGAGFQFVAAGVSADGSVVVGRRDTVTPPTGAVFRWTAGTGAVMLPDLPGGSVLAEARDISADGSTIVGTGNNSLNRQVAARWDNAGNVFPIGDLSGNDLSSFATSTSGDGSIIVGQATIGGGVGDVGFVWDAAHGIRSAAAYLASFGVTFPGWTLTSVSAVSSDGFTLVGIGQNPGGTVQGWIATVPSPAAGGLLLAAGTTMLAQRRRH